MWEEGGRGGLVVDLSVFNLYLAELNVTYTTCTCDSARHMHLIYNLGHVQFLIVHLAVREFVSVGSSF